MKPVGRSLVNFLRLSQLMCLLPTLIQGNYVTANIITRLAAIRYSLWTYDVARPPLICRRFIKKYERHITDFEMWYQLKLFCVSDIVLIIISTLK